MARTLNDTSTAKERTEKAVGNTSSKVATATKSLNSAGTTTDTHTSSKQGGSYTYGGTTYSYSPTTGKTTTVKTDTTTTNALKDLYASKNNNSGDSGDSGNAGVPDPEQAKQEELAKQKEQEELARKAKEAQDRQTYIDNLTKGKNINVSAENGKDVLRSYDWNAESGQQDFYKIADSVSKHLRDLGATDEEVESALDKFAQDTWNISYKDLYDQQREIYNNNKAYKEKEELLENQYGDAVNTANEAYNESLSAVNAEEAQAKSDAEEQARQAYIAKMLNDKDLVQSLQAQGINGGASESAKLALLSNYENTREGINSNLSKALSAYGLQRSQLANELAQAKRTASNAYDQGISEAELARDQANAQAKTPTTTTTTEVPSTVPTLSGTKNLTLSDYKLLDKANVNSMYDVMEKFGLGDDDAKNVYNAYANYKRYNNDSATSDVAGHFQIIKSDIDSYLSQNDKTGARTYLDNMFNNGQVTNSDYLRLRSYIRG